MSSEKSYPMTRRSALKLMAAVGSAAAFNPAMSWGKSVKKQRQLWVTNAYGDDVHVFEVGSWKLLRHFVIGTNPHGISATADGRTVHINIEHIYSDDNGELIWIVIILNYEAKKIIYAYSFNLNGINYSYNYLRL